MKTRSIAAAVGTATLGLLSLGSPPAGASGATASWAVSNELELGAPVTVSAANWQRAPSVAFDGTNFFVVWQDARTGGSDIVGARVTPTGEVLDMHGIPIATSSAEEVEPFVTYDGRQFLVGWTEHAAEGNLDRDVRAARVSSDGTVLDSGGIDVYRGIEQQTLSGIAADGAQALLVWFDRRDVATSGDRLYAARVDPGGAVLDPGGVPLPLSWDVPAVAFDGAGYTVVAGSSDYRVSEVRTARLDRSANPLDASSRLLAAVDQGDVVYGTSLAFRGGTGLAVWGLIDRVDGARLRNDGTVIDVTPRNLLGSVAYAEPAVAAGSEGYLVVAGTGIEPGGVVGTRVMEDGSVLDDPPLDVGRGIVTGDVALTFGAGQFLLAGMGSLGVCAGRIPARTTDPVTDPIPISQSANTQRTPAVAAGASGWLAVWTDERSGSLDTDIYAIRIDGNGVTLDRDAIPISTAPGIQRSPSVAYAGGDYIVVWEDRRNDDYQAQNADVYAARVTSEGVVRDPDGIAVSTAPSGQWTPRIACAGDRCVVAWESNDTISDTNYFPQPGNIEAARMNADGVVLDAEPISVSALDADEDHPDVAFDGTRFAIVWRSERELGTRSFDYSSLSGSAATYVGTADSSTAPRLVKDATGFVVAWQDLSDAVRAARLAQEAQAPADTVVIGTGAHGVAAPATGFDGSRIVVTWIGNGAHGRDLFATTLAPNLSPASAEPDIVSAELGDEGSPALSANEGGRVLVAYERFVWQPDGALRVRGRTMTPGNAGQTPPDSNSNRTSEDDGGCAVARGGAHRALGATLAPLVLGIALFRARRRRRSAAASRCHDPGVSMERVIVARCLTVRLDMPAPLRGLLGGGCLVLACIGCSASGVDEDEPSCAGGAPVWEQHIAGASGAAIASNPSTDEAAFIVRTVAEQTGTTLDTSIVSITDRGDERWRRSFGSAATSLAFGREGELFVTGSFEASLDLGDAVVGGTDQVSALIARLDSQDGHTVWAKAIDEVGGGLNGWSVAPDVSGGVVLLGHYAPTPPLEQLPNPPPSEGFVVAKLDASGNELWRRTIGDLLTYVRGNGIAVDAGGEVLVTGWVNRGTIDLGGGPIPASTEERSFVVKFAPDGSFRWARTIPGGLTLAESVAVALDRSLYVAGNIGIDGVQFTTQPFVTKLDAGGTVLWTANLVGQQGVDVRVAVRNCGGILLASNSGPAAISEVSASGEPGATHVLGLPENSWISGVAADRHDALFVCGDAPMGSPPKTGFVSHWRP